MTEPPGGHDPHYRHAFPAVGSHVPGPGQHRLSEGLEEGPQGDLGLHLPQEGQLLEHLRERLSRVLVVELL